MRIPKFRAWRPDPSLYLAVGMYEVDSLHFYPEHGGGEAFYKVEGDGQHTSDFFEDIALMQFTGILDKNAVEIYEGDIVRSHEGTGYVEFSPEHGAFAIDYWEFGQRESRGILLSAIQVEELEVVGNVHENPELLKAA